MNPPKPPRFILSDNGSEFMGHFQQRLDEHRITHWWTYPRSPKMNPHAERFNRTIQEQFVDYHEEELFYDLPGFNRKLAGWLLDYNTVLPHHSLGLQSPVNYLIHNQPERQNLPSRKWGAYSNIYEKQVYCPLPGFGRKFRELLRLFCLDIEADKAAEIAGHSRPSVNKLFDKIKERIAYDGEQSNPFDQGEVDG